jgi:hypothetical protein
VQTAGVAGELDRSGQSLLRVSRRYVLPVLLGAAIIVILATTVAAVIVVLAVAVAVAITVMLVPLLLLAFLAGTAYDILTFTGLVSSHSPHLLALRFVAMTWRIIAPVGLLTILGVIVRRRGRGLGRPRSRSDPPQPGPA